MSELDMQQKILSALSELKSSQASVATELQGVATRLGRVHVAVNAHEKKLSGLQLELADRAAAVKSALTDDLTVHIMNCPWRVRVDGTLRQAVMPFPAARDAQRVYPQIMRDKLASGLFLAAVFAYLA
jgi:hypothetical protein